MDRDAVAFVASIESFAKAQKIPVITFQKDSARTISPLATGPNSLKMKAWSSSARPRRKLPCSAPRSDISNRAARAIPGLCGLGLRLALFYTRTYVSVLRPGLSQVVSPKPPGDIPLRLHFDKVTEAIEQWCRDAKLAA
ncbi:MAG: hypothetical protein ACR2HX_03010 [Pyrinomonadaceae bacterium]